MVLISMVLAVKYHEDRYLSNEDYARVGGIPKEEVNFLEREFLRNLDYKLYVRTR